MRFNRARSFLLVLVVAVALTGCATWKSRDDRPFTVIVLPDTQNYADADAIKKGGASDLRQYFFDQTQWIKDNKKALNIVMVAHEGDVVQSDHPDEWAVADQALGVLDPAVPYILCLGNHDIGRGSGSAKEPASRATNLNDYFPPSRFEDNPLYQYGGNFEGKSDNYYLLFEAGGAKFIIMAVEFKPRDAVLIWANGVMARYPDRYGIVVTHAYLGDKAERRSSDNYGHRGNGAEAMWDKFLAQHENIGLLLCGHVLGEARRTDLGHHGNPIHQLLADYQGRAKGGEGYLRIMTFHPKEKRIDVQSYSPSRDDYLTGDESQFSLPF